MAGFIKALFAAYAAPPIGIYVIAASASLVERGPRRIGSFFLPYYSLIRVPTLMLAGMALLLPAAPKAETMVDASPQ